MPSPPTSPFASFSPTDGTRGSCPTLSIFQTCYSCPLVTVCSYKTTLGDYGEAEAMADAALGRTITTTIAELLDESRSDAERTALADRLLADSQRDDLSDELRARIGNALGEYGDVRAFELLGATLLNPRLGEGLGYLREEAAIFLGELGDIRATNMLVQVLDDWKPALRFAAAVGLARLGNPTAIADLREAGEIRQGDDFGQLNEQVHEMCLFARALLGDRDTRETLEILLHDADGRLALSRAEIVHALGELGCPESLPALLALRHPDLPEGLDRHLSIALGRLGHADAQARLVDFLSAADAETAVNAARALAKQGNEAGLDVLALRGLTSRIGTVRRLTAQALAELDTSRSHELLHAYLSQEPVASIREAVGVPVPA